MSRRHVVIGAGIAGVCTAMFLRRAGEDVTLVDPLPAQGGASIGNAGIISPDTAVPIALPGMLRKVPGWLTDPEGPLTIRPGYIPELLPWLARWLLASRPSEVERLSHGIRALHRSGFDVYRELLPAADFASLLRPGGHLQLFEGVEQSRSARAERHIRELHGIEAHDLSFAELRKMIPALADRPMRGILIPGNGHTVSPRRLMTRLIELARTAGVHMAAERALRLIPKTDGSWLVMTNSANHMATSVTVAAGAWSGALLSPLGIHVPLDTERGYHSMIPNPSVQLPYTVLHKDWGISFSPFEEGLCLSGTVEFAGLHAPPNPRRAELLVEKGRRIFPALQGDTPTIWLGFRPSIPDSLPVISPAPNWPNLHLIFGHGHNGMTGGVTGAKLLVQMILQQPTFIDPKPYDVRRFSR